MKVITAISNIVIPFIICFIIFIGLIEKKKTFNIFLQGVKEGLQIVYDIFPTLLGIFLSIEILRSSGFLDIITEFIGIFTNKLGFPKELIPLAILRPISGSAALGIATDIMKHCGVDSKIGLIASTIMASTETTFYTITLYTTSIGVKKIRFVLIAALIADIVGIMISTIIWNCLI